MSEEFDRGGCRSRSVVGLKVDKHRQEEGGAETLSRPATDTGFVNEGELHFVWQCLCTTINLCLLRARRHGRLAYLRRVAGNNHVGASSIPVCIAMGSVNFFIDRSVQRVCSARFLAV